MSAKVMAASAGRTGAVCLAGFLAAALSCSPQQITGTGGTGSETVIGRIFHEDGTPAGKTVVTLRACNYNPGLSATPLDYGVDTTDAQGRYAIIIDSPTVKKFTLQAVNIPRRTRTVVADIDFSTQRDSVVVDAVSLHNTGKIKTISSDSSISGNGYMFIPGTSYHASIENGYAVMDSVPAQIIPRVLYVEIAQGNPARSLAESVDVKAGMTTIIAYSGAANSMKFYLNTTSSGANVMGNVLGFPLLIRLTADNFDFGAARTDGSDIRFTKSDDTPLSFEIERWSAAAKQAEIWVRVDTVYGNDSSHFIAMYWGEPATIISKNTVPVFDTAIGYRGVWHLAEEAAGVGTKSLYKDATGQNNGDDFISSTDRSGIIGYGHAFNGISDYIPVNGSVTNFFKGDLTISLWVSIGDSAGTILSRLDTSLKWTIGASSYYFGDGTNGHVSPGVNGAYASFVGFHDDYNIIAQPVASDGWHYLVYTWKWNGDSTGAAKYYIDGREVGLQRDSLKIRFSENANATLRIGQPNSNESYRYFKGLMDELEISAVVRSADWIKLCYSNQGRENVLAMRKIAR